jgi:hypothetical protein
VSGRADTLPRDLHREQSVATPCWRACASLVESIKKRRRKPVPVSRARTFASATLVLLTVIAAVPTSSYAQDELREKGNRACSGDARRICKHVLGQGDMIVLQCFQQNKSKLSGSCRKFLIEVGQLQ